MQNIDTSLKKRKRHRRLAAEIVRRWKCLFPNCGRSYGTLGALKTHIKIKHPHIKNLDCVVDSFKSAKAEQGCIIPHSIPLDVTNNTNTNNDSTVSSSSCCSLSPLSEEFQIENWLPSFPLSDIMHHFFEQDFALFKTGTSAGVNCFVGSSNEYFITKEINIPILQLQIGNWVKTRTLIGDLTMKISLERKKFSWEHVMSQNSLKLEVLFDDISRFSIEHDHNGTTVLIIETIQPLKCTCGKIFEGNTFTSCEYCDDFSLETPSCYIVHVQHSVISEPLQRLLKEQPRLEQLVQLSNMKFCN